MGAAQLALAAVDTTPTRPRARRRRAPHVGLRFVCVRALERPTLRPEALAVVREVLAQRDELGEEVHGGLLLGDALVRLRTRLLLSQEQVMERTGIGRRRMRAIEGGDDAAAEELVALGLALDVPPAGLAALPAGRTIKPTRITAEAAGFGPLVLPGLPGSLSWEKVPYARDAMAQGFVADHGPDATVEMIAAAFGFSTRFVERTLEEALAKARAALEEDE